MQAEIFLMFLEPVQP